MTDHEKTLRAAINGLLATHGESCISGAKCQAVVDGRAALASLAALMEEREMMQDALTGLRTWIEYKLANGPVETKGYSDSSGHPHYWAAVLIPDWELKQKLAELLPDTATGESAAPQEGRM